MPTWRADILGYVRRDLRSPEGGFYCAEDADSLLAPGAPNTRRARSTSGRERRSRRRSRRRRRQCFATNTTCEADGNAPAGSDPQGEFTGKNILFARRPPLEERSRGAGCWQSARAKLFAVRAEPSASAPGRQDRHRLERADDFRVRPRLRRRWRRTRLSGNARRAADFIRDESATAKPTASCCVRTAKGPARRGRVCGRLRVSHRKGCSTCTRRGSTLHISRWAEQLQGETGRTFPRSRSGGYFSASERDASVLLRLKEDHDGAEPSASSVAAFNLARLAAHDGPRRLAATRRHGDGVRAAYNPARTAQTMPLMLAALDFLADVRRRSSSRGTWPRRTRRRCCARCARRLPRERSCCWRMAARASSSWRAACRTCKGWRRLTAKQRFTCAKGRPASCRSLNWPRSPRSCVRQARLLC